MKQSSLTPALWHRLGSIAVLLSLFASILAQSPAPTATAQEKRGIGTRPAATDTPANGDRSQREAKPELIMQTGYNNYFGATQLVFSPDGRLLATTTFHSSTVKLWDTTNGRELRDLSSAGQTPLGRSPVVAFSRDSRLLAAAATDNTIKIWNLITGAEVQTLSGSQSSFMAAIGVYFVDFSADGRRLVSASDAIRVWDLASGTMLREVGGDT